MVLFFARRPGARGRVGGTTTRAVFTATAVSLTSICLGKAAHQLILVDPTQPIHTEWIHRSFSGSTDYQRVELDGVAYIRAIGRESASGLYRSVQLDVGRHPWLEWTWRVDEIQTHADIRTKEGEDYAAAIFLIFGKPDGIRPSDPTLGYVWIGGQSPRGGVIPHPLHSDSMRNVVLRNRDNPLGQIVKERRNVVEDFRMAYGREPPAAIEMIALWTDNDQTREPVTAYYGALKAYDD